MNCVSADELREHVGGEHRRATGLRLQDDLQQDRARQVISGLRIDDPEFLVLQNQFLHVGQRDVAAGLGVVQTPVRILLDQADSLSHDLSNN